jgi:glycosyltransferase involved in cell wall biosynthesis
VPDQAVEAAMNVNEQLPSRTSAFSEYRDALTSADVRSESRAITIDGAPIGDYAELPLVTVVTISYNSEATVARTIESVLNQTYRMIEYVIIDGGSRDATVSIIERNRARLSYWRSGPDGGISNAFNLGVAVARGRYVAIVNSDDWMSPDQIAQAVKALEESGAAFAFGNLAMHSYDGNLAYVMEGRSDYWKNMRYRMPYINHPTVVVRRDAYEKVGPFDSRRRIAMDFDWHLRAELLGVRGVYVPQLIGHMGEGGVSNQGWRAGLREVRAVAIEHGQSWFLAHVFYLGRTARAYIRLGMHRLMPQAWVNFVHRKINPQFKQQTP